MAKAVLGLILFMGVTVSLNAAEDSILGISIIGNKESPRVLTIVPWRQPLADGIEPEVIPIWKPELKLLAPDSYIRDIDLFLEQRQLRLEKVEKEFQNAN